MNIKRRLIISNTVMVVIPFIVTFLAACAFIFVSSHFLNKNMNYDAFKETAMVKSEMLSEINGLSKQPSDVIEQADFQRELLKKMDSINGKVIIAKNDDMIFASKNINRIDLEKCLKEIDKNSFNKMVKISNVTYIIETIPIKNGSGDMDGQLRIILLAPLENNMLQIRNFLIVIILVFIISFIIVNIMSSYLFSKRIIKPVTMLKSAASEIRKGNLDCEIIEDGDDEIKELCHDFEIMRIQLKDSVNMRMKYDDNRKMLVSSISHDLKTPISSIKGYVEGILDGVANTQGKVQKYLKTIYSKAEHVDTMIDDLLLYSKLDLNQIPFNFEKTDIVQYFEYCVSENYAELKRHNIEINLINNLKDLIYVMLDRDRMKRVIMNIIDNSRKYMDKSEGKIDICLRETNLSIIIEIRDNGPGISEDDVNKIFDRFYREDSARSEAKGSGLGLAIAKQIVEGHHGKIWAVNHENEGTSIIISLAKTH